MPPANTSPPIREAATRLLVDAMQNHQAGKLEDAERLYRAALEQAPQNGEALRWLATLYLQMGDAEQALPLFVEASKARPNDADILNNLGVALRNTGKGEEAFQYFQKALDSNPFFGEALMNLGDCLRERGQEQAARDCYEKVLSEKPGDDYAMRNHAAVLRRLGRDGEARAIFEHVLQQETGNVDVMVKLGGLLHCEGQIDEALHYYNRALALAPDHRVALWDKGLALLSRGEFREGWKLYELGWGAASLRGFNRFDPVKMWDGKPAPGKHLLLWSEQGLGDSLQFIRYAEYCKTQFAKVSVLCPKPLIRLFQAVPYVDDVFGTIPAGSHFDEHIPMLSVPYVCDTVLETIPAAVPYLAVDPALKALWTEKFRGVAERKIGLVWAGGSRPGLIDSNLMDQKRSIRLEKLSPLLDLPGARFYNLQMDTPAEQIAALGFTDRISNFMGEVQDFADTAALVDNLDLVITVDTSVAHLAGGLGKPVWILSRYDACWRWLQNRPTNPWYPTARIFGQPSHGDWDGVIKDVSSALASWLESEPEPACP